MVTGALMLFTAPAAHAADIPLRDLGAAKGKIVGTAVTGSKLTGTYGDIAGTQFSSLTPGNAMKWESVEPTQGSFDWTEADQIVAFAEAHDQRVRGHTLVWHSQNPSWLTNGSWTSARLSSLLQNHISTEVGRYKGRIAAWDVVNEPFNEDGTYRSALWYNGLGADYIATALTWAHAADPAAKPRLRGGDAVRRQPRAQARVPRHRGGARRHDHPAAHGRLHGGVQRDRPVEHRVHGRGADLLLRGVPVVLEGELDVRRRPAGHPGVERHLHPVRGGGDVRRRLLQRHGSGRRFGDLRVQRVLERQQSGAHGVTGLSRGPGGAERGRARHREGREARDSPKGPPAARLRPSPDTADSPSRP